MAVMEMMEYLKAIQVQLTEIQEGIEKLKVKPAKDDNMMRDNASYLIHMINNDDDCRCIPRRQMYITLLSRFPEELRLYVLMNIVDVGFVADIYTSVIDN